MSTPEEKQAGYLTKKLPEDPIISGLETAIHASEETRLELGNRIIPQAVATLIEKIETPEENPLSDKHAYTLRRVETQANSYGGSVEYFLEPPWEIIEQTEVAMVRLVYKQTYAAESTEPVSQYNILLTKDESFGGPYNPMGYTSFLNSSDRALFLANIVNVYQDIQQHGIQPGGNRVLLKNTQWEQPLEEFQRFVAALPLTGQLEESTRQELRQQEEEAERQRKIRTTEVSDYALFRYGYEFYSPEERVAKIKSAVGENIHTALKRDDTFTQNANERSYRIGEVRVDSPTVQPEDVSLTYTLIPPEGVPLPEVTIQIKEGSEGRTYMAHSNIPQPPPTNVEALTSYQRKEVIRLKNALAYMNQHHVHMPEKSNIKKADLAFFNRRQDTIAEKKQRKKEEEDQMESLRHQLAESGYPGSISPEQVVAQLNTLPSEEGSMLQYLQQKFAELTEKPDATTVGRVIRQAFRNNGNGKDQTELLNNKLLGARIEQMRSYLEKEGIPISEENIYISESNGILGEGEIAGILGGWGRSGSEKVYLFPTEDTSYATITMDRGKDEVFYKGFAPQVKQPLRADPKFYLEISIPGEYDPGKDPSNPFYRPNMK